MLIFMEPLERNGNENCVKYSDQEIQTKYIFIFCVLFKKNRVINAGKSTHNEDQASCEVVAVKKKAGVTNSTPNKNVATKRRSSLPNGEGLQLKENAVSNLVS